MTIITRPGTGIQHSTHGPGRAHYDMGWWTTEELIVPEDMWLTGFSAKNSGVRMHNFYLFLKGSRDSWCPENPKALYSGGTVTADKRVSFPPPYGIFVRKGDVLIFKTFFVGQKEDKKDEYLSLRVLYEPASISDRKKSLSMHLLTPGVCDIRRPIFSIPPYSTNAQYDTMKRPFVFDEDSVILKMGGHFHGSYAQNIENTLEVFLNNERIVHFSTTNIGNGNERNPELLARDTPFFVDKGDSLWMRATFNNPSSETVEEGMAIVGFYVGAR